MNTKSTQKLDYVKIQTARDNLGKVMKSTSDTLTKLTAQNIATAQPEDVVKALTEVAVPAIQETMQVVNDIVDALPAEEDTSIGENESEITTDENPITGDEDADSRMKELEEKTASLLKENINMKKASLAKRLANTYPPNMRKAAEDDFMKENEEEDDLDVLEAKVASAEKVVKGYLDANMINKTRTSLATAHTAKLNGRSKMHTAKDGGSLSWALRT